MFIWPWGKSKTKYEAICNDYENGGLKKVDIYTMFIMRGYKNIF